MVVSLIRWLRGGAINLAIIAVASACSPTVSSEAPPPSACAAAVTEFDVAVQRVSRELGQPATRAAGMPVELAAGAAVALVERLFSQTELRAQCYEAMLRHAGFGDAPPYDRVRHAIARTHPELPPETPAWIKTDAGCQVGVPFSGLDLHGLTAQWSGPCVDGKASGRGQLVIAGPAGSISYDGDVRNGLPEGRGFATKSDGDRYEGDFRAGFPDGKGVMTSVGGDRVAGDSRIGLPHGQAVFTDAKGNRYEGNYAHGLPEGHGKTFYVSGNHYEGEYHNGKRNGRGVFYLANGGRYEGEWHDDKRQGHGILIAPDGSRFEGEFADDRPLSGSIQHR
jgi:hypothetical protein